ncbi:unnamed protein product [Musa textilis]
MMATSVASPGSRTPRASSNFVTRAQRSPIPNPIPLPDSVVPSKAFAFLSCGSSLGGRGFSRGSPDLDFGWLLTACPFSRRQRGRWKRSRWFLQRGIQFLGDWQSCKYHFLSSSSWSGLCCSS